MRDRYAEITQSNVSGSFTTEVPKAPVDYGKIRTNTKNLDDATLNLSSFKKANPRLADKHEILRAIANKDVKLMREISNYFYETSGIYKRTLRYFAYLYKYDWFISPFVIDESTPKNKLLTAFSKCLSTVEGFNTKKNLGDIALQVLINGAYYGYKVDTSSGTVLQELPANYCRTRYFCNGKPTVEFNMKYFDESFTNTEYRLKILKLFPKEFLKGYALYKQGKLKTEFPGDQNGWYLLDPTMTVKFNFDKDDTPPFISVIPLILDLDEAQELDRRRTLQRLLKIVIQKMPLDKNGDLIFDIDEAQQLHNNAVQMLGNAIGVNVLTTFADVAVEDISHSNVASTQTDDLERVERQLYNETGIAEMLFNTSGNIALDKSITNDGATIYNLILQFEDFLNDLIAEFNTSPKKFIFRVQILGTTIYNYLEVAKMYKEQAQLGYSKMLPQVALGQSQSSILANAYFENEILNLSELFIPPMQSSVMNADALQKIKGSGSSDNKGGRPEKPDDQKAEKTIQNRESMS